MKHRIVRTVVSLILLLTLVAIFGGINPIPAHADPIPVHADALQRVDCSTGNPVRIRTDFGQDVDCFEGIGGLPVMIYNADTICTGDSTNDVIVFQVNGYAKSVMSFPDANACYSIGSSQKVNSIDSGGQNVNQILSIMLNTDPNLPMKIS